MIRSYLSFRELAMNTVIPALTRAFVSAGTIYAGIAVAAHFGLTKTEFHLYPDALIVMVALALYFLAMPDRRRSR